MSGAFQGRYRDEFGVVREADGSPVVQGALVQTKPEPGTYDDGRTGLFGKAAANISNLIGAETFYNKDQGLIPAFKNTMTGLGHMVGAFSPFTFSDPKPTGIDLGRGRGAYTQAPQVTGFQVPPMLEELRDANNRAKLGVTNDLDGLTIAGSAMMGGGFGMKAAEAANLGSKISLGDRVVARAKMRNEGPPLDWYDVASEEQFPSSYPAVEGSWGYIQDVPWSGEQRAMGKYEPMLDMADGRAANERVANDPLSKVTTLEGRNLYSNSDETSGALGAFAQPLLDYTTNQYEAAFLREPGAFGAGMRSGPSTPVEPVPGRVLNEGFYSVLDEALAGAQMKQGNAQAWTNAFKKAGVKDSEIYWRGLDDFLKSKNPNAKITKEEIAQHLSDNEVRVHSKTHTEDGYSAESLRDSELENLHSSFADNFDPKDYGFKIEEYVPDDDAIQRYIQHSGLKIVEEPADLFGGAPSYAVKYDGAPAYGRYDTMEEAQAGRLEFAKQKLINQNDPYRLTKDGEEVSTHGSEEDAWDSALEDAMLQEERRIEEMSDRELFRQTDTEPAATAGGYMEAEKPSGGSDYRETILVTNPQTLARKNSGGWTSGTGLSRDGIHPDSLYDHVPGWRLEEDYTDMMNPGQSGTLVHELQSRWHARGSEKGWKSAVDPVKHQELEDAAKREADAYYALEPKTKYTTTYAPTGHSGQIIKWKHDAPDDVRTRSGNLLNLRDLAYRNSQSIADATREIERKNGRIERFKKKLESEQGLTPEQASDIERFISEDLSHISEQQDRIRSAKDLYDTEIAPYVEETWDAQDSNQYKEDRWNTYYTWKNAVDSARLRMAEAGWRLLGYGKGAEPGPWVAGDKSDIMALLLKQGLYEAAQRADDFFGVQGPDRMKARYGERGPHEDYGRVDPKTGKEAGVIPKTLEKLIRMHNKDAKLERIYPGKAPKARGAFFEEPYRTSLDDTDAPRMAFGAPVTPMLGPKSHMNPLTSQLRVTDVVLTKDHKGDPVYVLRTTGEYKDQVFSEADPEDGYYVGSSGGVTRGLRSSYGGRNGEKAFHAAAFKSKAAAENAMRDINKSLLKESRRLRDPEYLKERFAEEDPVGEPFWGVRLDKKTRDSIAKRGFPLFVNASGGGPWAEALGAFMLSKDREGQ